MKEVKSESSIKTFQLHKNYRKRIISAGEFEISDLKLPKETGAERCFAVDKKKQEEYHFVKEHIKKPEKTAYTAVWNDFTGRSVWRGGSSGICSTQTSI